MHRTKTLSILAIFALLGIVALVGAMTFQSVSAQTPTETPEPENGTESNAPAPDELRKRGHRIAGGVTQEALAQALGIEVETLQAAQETAAQQALEQAVSAGLITQEQADRLSERGLGKRFGFGKGILEANEINYDALLAAALNVSVEDLEAARQQAFTTIIDNAVAAGTLTQEQGDLIKGEHGLYANEGFQSNINSAFEAAVEQAVSDGVITQAQADLILQAQAERGGFFGRGGGGGFHFFGGRGHGRGGQLPYLPDQQPEVTPPDTGTSLDL